ncbi:MAG: glycosyltransferase [Phycisphaerae bacterium]|nr:glycosyltransferase [Phycisphaerae bacterium]
MYNKERTVARTIKSILEQTFQDWRLIIVNDGSTDGSLSLVREFTDGRIEIIEQENQGPGPARNTGIKAATAGYVAFLDADDEWYPWYLENSLKAFDGQDVAMVSAMYEQWPEGKDMTAVWADRNVRPGVYEFNDNSEPRDVLSHLFFCLAWNTIVRTSDALECGGFYDDEKCLLGEDTVFFAKLIFCKKFAIIGPAAVRHNRQDSDLANVEDRPMDICLKKPDIILRFLPQDMKNFGEKVLAWHALRVAHFLARSGNKTDALYLKEHFPQMRQFKALYLRLCVEILCSRWLRHWVNFKCLVGPPVREWLRKRFCRDK